MRRWIAAALMAYGLSRPSGAQQIPIKAGVVATPDTVRIGDPFRVSAGIRAPLGATIEFPPTTDSTSTIQSLDAVVVRTSPDSSAVEQYADYRVAAWDVGSQPVRLGDAIVRVNGVERRIPLNASVFVRSVLPVDTTKRVPKPPRALFEVRPFPWWLIAALVAAIVAGLLLWWWLHRRNSERVVAPVDPYARAQSEFQRIEALGLLGAGERGRHVALMVEVLRDYLAARYVEASLSLTSSELQRSLRTTPHVPQERLLRVLTEADLIKFARRPVSAERAGELGREAQAIVADEHTASQPAEKPAEKPAEAAA